MEQVFDNDEIGYLRWADEHQDDGFIINTDGDERSPDYPMVHRASPGAMTTAKRGNYTTGRFFKVCSTDMSDLEAWARRVRNRSLTHCKQCM